MLTLRYGLPHVISSRCQPDFTQGSVGSSASTGSVQYVPLAFESRVHNHYRDKHCRMKDACPSMPPPLVCDTLQGRTQSHSGRYHVEVDFFYFLIDLPVTPANRHALHWTTFTHDTTSLKTYPSHSPICSYAPRQRNTRRSASVSVTWHIGMGLRILYARTVACVWWHHRSPPDCPRQSVSWQTSPRAKHTNLICPSISHLPEPNRQQGLQSSSLLPCCCWTTGQCSNYVVQSFLSVSWSALSRQCQRNIQQAERS